MEAKSAVHAWSWLNFKLIRNFIVVTITCKNEEDPIKSESARVVTTLYTDFSDTQEQVVNSVVSGRNWLKFKLIQVFMHVLVSCENEKDPFKNKGTRVFTTFLPL